MNNTRTRNLILVLVDDQKLTRHIQASMQADCEIQVLDSLSAIDKNLDKQPAVVLLEAALLGDESRSLLGEIQAQEVAPMVTLLVENEQLNAAIQYLHEGLIYRFQTSPYDRQQLELAISACIEQYSLLSQHRAMENEISRQVELRTDDLHKLYDYVSIINDRESIQEICELAVKLTADILDSKRVSLLLPDRHNRLLEMIAATGIAEYVRQDVRIPIGQGIAGKVFSRCDSIIVSDQEDLDEQDGRYDSECFASIPLISTSMMRAGKPVGVLNVTEPNHLEEYDEEALANLRAIAEATAIAIENKRHVASSINSRDSVIMALARLSEYRNPDAGIHLQRLQVYCRHLSMQLQKNSEYSAQINHEFIDDIIHAAPLHDIGKAGIKEDILFHDGVLSDEDKQVLRSHTQIGGDTLKALIDQGNNEGFLKMAVKIAYCHHERWDGSGYPKGLKELAIPLAARIFAVADVYDALCSERHHKKALPHSKARSIILEGGGTLFDPEVIRAFLGCEERFASISDQGLSPLTDSVDDSTHGEDAA